MRGALAFRKLQALADPDELRRVLNILNEGSRGDTAADITSCAATAIAVVKTLTNQPIVSGIYASMVTGGKVLVCKGQNNVQTSEIMKNLGKDQLVMISLTFKKTGSGGGDHHFAAFALDKNTIVAAMGWQKHYDLSMWFSENEQGKFKKDKFQGLMSQIENGNSDAVAELCAYLGATKSGGSVPETIFKEVHGYRAHSTAQAFQLPSA